MKITYLQVHEAFYRCAGGESVRSVAKGLGVTEGALRFHFRKGTHPNEVQRIAFAMFHAEQARAALTPAQQRAVDRLVAKRLAGQRAGMSRLRQGYAKGTVRAR